MPGFDRNSPQIVNLSGSGLSTVSIAPAALNFPSTPVGTTSAPIPFTISNNTGSAVSPSAAASADYVIAPAASGGCGSNLSAHTKCTYNVTFQPSQNGGINGSVTISGPFPAQVVDLAGTGSGTAATLAFAPATLNFKTGQTLGTTSVPLTVVVTNKSTAAVNITALSGSSGFSPAPSGTVPCNGSLAAGKKCTFSVTFTPPTQGVVKGSISIVNSGAINPVLYSALGTGVPAVNFSPASVTYPATPVGSWSTATVNLVNSQNVNLNVSGMAASGEYQIHQTNCNNGPVAPGSSCYIDVWFWPSYKGTIKGAITVTDDAGTSPQVLPLTGTGQ